MNASRYLRIVTALFLTALIFGTGFARGQQPILTGDSQVNSSSTGTKYGAATSLTVNSKNTALFQFNLSDMLPSGTTASQVVKAGWSSIPTPYPLPELTVPTKSRVRGVSHR